MSFSQNHFTFRKSSRTRDLMQTFHPVSGDVPKTRRIVSAPSV